MHAFRLRACLCLALASFGGACAGTQRAQSTVSSDPLASIEAEQLFSDGQTLAAHGDLIRAEQYIAASIRKGYPERRALPTLMRVCIASSRLGSALQHATPYLRLHPEDHQLRFLVASVLIGLSRYDEARSDGEHADAHYLLGLLLRDHYGDADGAALHFTEHQRLAHDTLHGAEVAAWLSERERAETGAEVPEPALPDRMVLELPGQYGESQSEEATP
jgi:hypothetical protein